MNKIKKIIIPFVLVVCLFAGTLTVFAANESPSGDQFGDASLSKTQYTYSNLAKTPKVTVKDMDGNKLKEGVDYFIKYLDNVYSGTAHAVITGMGKYAGSTKTLDYNIAKARPFALVDQASVITIKAADSKKSKVKLGKIKLYVKQGSSYKYYSPLNKKATVEIVDKSSRIKIYESGMVSVRKGTKAGTYRLKLKITNAGKNFVDEVTRTIKIVVK